MSQRDYYEILGVNKTANNDELKKVYRELVMKYHPDRVPEEQKKEAEEKFKEISEAYAILSDPEKRSLYDQYGHSGVHQRYSYDDIFQGTDFSSIFRAFGGGSSFFDEILNGFRGQGGGRRTRNQVGQDLQTNFSISLEEAAFGAEKTISVNSQEVCPVCNGQKTKPGTKKTTCPECRGKGEVCLSTGWFQVIQTCSRCRGQGEYIQTPCTECSGQGKIRKKESVTITIPAGVDTGNHITIKNYGELGPGGKGNLHIVFEVQPHPIFERDGHDIIVQIHISVAKAILGGEATVPTLDGSVNLKIPSGTQSGKIFRIPNKGVPYKNSTRRGDENVVVIVDIPTKLNAEQTRLIQEFAKAGGENLLAKESLAEKVKKFFT